MGSFSGRWASTAAAFPALNYTTGKYIFSNRSAAALDGYPRSGSLP
jgi:hypothetical protein